MKPSQPKISIIIPIYNVASYLAPCLSSIINQSYAQLEIILINDGSTDHSRHICQAFAKADPRIILINQTNQGLSAARNAGIKKSTGTYLAFVDSDDWIDRDFVSKLHKAIHKTLPSIAVCGYQETNQDGHPTKSFTPKPQIIPGEQALTNLLVHQADLDIITWNKLYHRDLFTRHHIQFPVGKIHEDNFTTYQLFCFAHSVSYIDHPLYFYRKRPSSITAKGSTRHKAAYKEAAATTAITWLKKHRPSALPAAQISLLWAKLTHLDLMIESGNIDQSVWQQQIKWIKEQRQALSANQHLSIKLKLYLFLLRFGIFPYKTLKKVLLSS